MIVRHGDGFLEPGKEIVSAGTPELESKGGTSLLELLSVGVATPRIPGAVSPSHGLLLCAIPVQLWPHRCCPLFNVVSLEVKLAEGFFWGPLLRICTYRF